MTFSIPTQAGDDLGGGTNNPELLAEVHALAASCTDSVPFLLVPVRLQTRFVQVEQVVVGISSVSTAITTQLNAALTAATALATRTYVTVLPTGVKNRSQFKATVEQPLVDAAAADIATVVAAVTATQPLLRDVGEASAAEVAAINTLGANLAQVLTTAAGQLTGVRSTFQRAALLQAFTPARTQAVALVAQLTATVGPSADLFAALRAATVPTAGGASLADGVGTDSSNTAGLGRARIARSGQAFARLTTTLAALRADPTGSSAAAIAAASTLAASIAILPATWHAELAAQVADVASTTPGGPSAETRSADTANALAALSRTVAAIPIHLPVPGPVPGPVHFPLPIPVPAPVHFPVPVPLPIPPLQTTQLVDQLRIRIFPDDFSTVTHEAQLTADEATAGATFWDQVAAGGGDDAARRAAWRTLVQGAGPNRAAWIVRTTAPAAAPDAAAVTSALAAVGAVRKRIGDYLVKPPTQLGALVRGLSAAAGVVRGAGAMAPGAAARVRAAGDSIGVQLDVLRSTLTDPAVASSHDDVAAAHGELMTTIDSIPHDEELARAAVPDLADTDLKSGAWTAQPTAGLLPTRFVAVTLNGTPAADGSTSYAVSHVVAGGNVRADLALGPDPSLDPSSADVPHVGTDGTLVMGASLAWLTDYDAALDAGLAITVPISAAEADAGFDRVYVLGLTPGDDPAAAAQALADQLDNHHYTQRGLAVLPIGTPTNNTDTGSSGYSRGEDADASFDIELGPELVTAASGNPDGRRLATALGIDPARFDHIGGAGGYDIDAALIANAALWPATAGYALEELLGRTIPLAARDAIAAFAVPNVIGRGALPALRVGPQPYGVLPVMAFSRFEPTSDQTFQNVFRDVLLLMFADWAIAADQSIRTYTNRVSGQDLVLQTLGLDAVAAGYVQRFSLNAGRDGLGFGWASEALPPDVATTRIRTGPIAVVQRFKSIFDETLGTGGPLVTGGLISPTYASLYADITGSRAYEVTYIDQPVPLSGGVIVPPTATDLAADVTQLLSETVGNLAVDLGGQANGRPLVHLLLTQALLAQARDVALRILVDEGVLTATLREQVGSADLFTIPQAAGGPINVTRWSFLLDLLSRFDHRLDNLSFSASGLYTYLTQHPNDEQRMDDYLSFGGSNPVASDYPAPLTAPYAARLTQHREAVRQFGALDPGVATQVTVEHLDTCAYRLDAWLLGLATNRLSELRAGPDAADPKTGVHLGAFGWIDDLRRNAELAPAADVPPTLAALAGTPILDDPANEGFVHVPSLNHAATAAIMRAGYLAHAGGTTAGTQMSVNVSSRRVRSALTLLDGIGAGNELGALLGYQFERDLHDAADGGVILDPYIAPLRVRFPSAAGVDSTAEITSPDARTVTDGLALLTTVQADLVQRGVTQNGTLLSALVAGATYPGYPYGITAADGTTSLLPATTSPAALDLVLQALDRLADSVDAVADLAITEGTHQLVQGNHPRAAAALSALGAGTMPPRPEVVDTPTEATLVSHRCLLHLTPGAALPVGWPVATARANAEPALNAWLGELIGAPGGTRCQVLDAGGVRVADVSLTDLALQPIDLLAILSGGLDDAMTELSVRVLDTMRPVDVRDGTPAPVLALSLDRSPDWPADVRSLAETATLLELVAGMMRGARPATSADYVVTDSVTSSGAEPDATELAGRIAAATAALTALGGRLVALVSDGADADLDAVAGDATGYVAAHSATYRGTAAPGEHLPGLDRLWARRQDFRSALLDTMGFGVNGIVLPTRWTTRDQVGASWLAATESALVEIARRAAAAAAVTGTDLGAVTARCTALFTATLPIVAQFTLSDPAAVIAATQASPASEPALAVERWLAGTAPVRENINAYTTAIAVAEAFGTAVPAAIPVQFPVVTGEPWVGESAATSPGSRVSLVLLAPERIPADGTCVAVCIDTWDELIPADARTTGVAFHYDQPDAEPPQSLLLAVPPVVRGAWVWEDLVQTLHDTLELARIRTVEPEHLQDDLYGQLLPLLLGEQQPWADPISTGGPAAVSDHRVFLDFGEIVPVPSPATGGTT